MKGWYKESYRHYLASKGIRTNKYYKTMSVKEVSQIIGEMKNSSKDKYKCDVCGTTFNESGDECPGCFEGQIIKNDSKYPGIHRNLMKQRKKEYFFDKSKSQITTISPDEFLEEAPLNNMEEEDREIIDELKQNISKEGFLSFEKGLTGDTPPHLEYGEGDVLRRHEGRHRAVALKELNLEKMPVVIFKKGDKTVYKNWYEKYGKNEHEGVKNSSFANKLKEGDVESAWMIADMKRGKQLIDVLRERGYTNK